MYHIIGLFIFVLLLLSVFYDNLKNSKFLLFFIIFGLFILASIRYNIGTDYNRYKRIFCNIKPFNFTLNYSDNYEKLEPLFKYSTAILKNIIITPLFYFSFWGFITLFFVWKGIKEQSKNYLLSIFIFYCIFYVNYLFNGIRQGIVMGIFLFSLKYIVERKIIPVLIVTFIATMLHTSGIFILIAYLFSKMKINRLTLILLLFSSLIIWQYGYTERLFYFIVKFFPKFLNEILIVYAAKFFEPLILQNILQRFLILIPILYFYPQLSDNNTIETLFPIYYWGTIFYLLLGFWGLFATRINMFFRMIELIIIPILYEKVHGKKQKIFILVIIMGWCFVVLSWVYAKGAYHPFKTIFCIR